MLKFHNVGFSSEGKPIFPNSASKRKREGNCGREEISEEKRFKRSSLNSPNRSSPKQTKWRPRSSSCSPAFRQRNPRLKSLGHRIGYKFSPIQKSRFQGRLLGWLPRIQQIAEDNELLFFEKKTRDRTKVFGIVSRVECDENALCPLRLVCDALGFYKIEVFFLAKERGRFRSTEDVKEVLLRLFGPNSPLAVCRGIADYDEHGKHLGYSLKNVRKWELPFKRVDSEKCELLHKPKNRKYRTGDVLYDVCTPCKKLHRNLCEALSRRKGKGDDSSCSRTSPSSKCNWKFLSPKSAKKRRNALSSSKRKLEREVRKLKSSRCTLSVQQDLEMRKIVNTIEKDFGSELQGVIDDSSKGENGKADILRAVWEQDVKDRKEFWNDQRRNNIILGRARRNTMLRVPELKYRYVFRDSWTRLNVKPAKVMQQDHVIGELKEYQATGPPDADKVSMTVQYLEAAQSLFEFGVLSHEKITDVNSPVLRNMEEGFLFFVGWADYCYGEGNDLPTPKQTVFLSWQTWDLLRLMYYGFCELCHDFFERFPGFYLIPLRINGSAIETVFSQLRFSTTGNLTACNYGYALSSLTLKRFLHGHRGKFKYRNTRLYVRQRRIKRRKNAV